MTIKDFPEQLQAAFGPASGLPQDAEIGFFPFYNAGTDRRGITAQVVHPVVTAGCETRSIVHFPLIKLLAGREVKA